MKSKPVGASLGAALLGLLCLPQSVLASEAWDQSTFNFKAADDDVVLPMPCGGSMTFRKVVVPSENIYSDYAITIGTADENLGYAEGARTAHVAGSFSDGKTQRYFLMAKYEVNVAQYEAIMNDGQCPEKPTMAKRLPKGEVGWIDAINFADKYSQWLRKNAATKLPKEDSESGYVRLPTEVEWEFAARGGIKTSPSEFSDRVFPMPKGMVSYVWYAGTQSANGKPQLGGLLDTNPLGLHDMLGNVDEITLEPFRLNRLDRAHGQVGAFVVRGGNYLTADQDIRSSYRQEVPLYQGDAPRRSKTTGFRVVVAAPVLTSPDKLRSAQSSWSKLGSVSAPPSPTSGLTTTAAEDPLEELAILAKAAPDAAMKARLQNLQTALRANIATRDELQDRAAKSSLRLGAFLGRKLSDDTRAVNSLDRLYKARIESGLKDDQRTKDFKQQLDQEQAVTDGNLRYYADSLIRTAEDFSPDVLKRQRDILVVELKGMGLGELQPYVERHFDHILAYQKDRKIARMQWLADWNKMP